MGQQTEQVLKPHGLTGTQYNVLRILRGAGPEGLPCKSVGDLMISHDPDMTRAARPHGKARIDWTRAAERRPARGQDADHTGWSRYPEKN